MTPIRTEQEEAERRNLSPRATLSAKSAGRELPEEPCPIRTEFQRDRDRIIHSRAFRRLKHKTQVFIDPEEDHFRTRLTHTLEVSQIARTIARALKLNEDLTEAIALGHDLGHTPFGHAGERALDEIYREYVPSAWFRHNEQSLRVVERLERDGRGLNLTFEVRKGILHHSKGSSDLTLGASEPGVTLESRVVRVADRIAYINHDIDDAISAGAISQQDLPAVSIRVFGVRHSERIAAMVVDLVENSRDKPILSMSADVLSAMDILKDFLFERVYGPNASGPRAEELRRAERLVKELFTFYMDHPEHLRLEASTLEDRARRVCDYIAGMTDRYAQRQYTEHFMPDSTGVY